MIRSSDISFVIQGPIQGKSFEPVSEQITRRCAESIRRWFSGAEIIISTWHGADVSQIPHDILVLNNDPGPIDLMNSDQAGLNSNPNMNRMIVSSASGLSRATRPWAVRTRTDMLFTSSAIKRWMAVFPKTNGSQVFQNRVVIPTISTTQYRRRLESRIFHLSDWLHAGLISDIRKLWNCALVSHNQYQHNEGSAISKQRDHLDIERYSNEQYLWLNLAIDSHLNIEWRHPWDMNRDNQRLFDNFVAQELVIGDLKRLGIVNLKHHHKPTATLNNFTFMEWRKLQARSIRSYQDFPMDWETAWRTLVAGLHNFSGGRLIPFIACASRFCKRLVGKAK